MKSKTVLLLLSILPLACEAPGREVSAPVSRFDTEETKRLRVQADAGDAKAQYSLAAIYFGARGGSRDDAQAAHWFRKAAEQGRADAQYYFGEMYYMGRGVAQDFSVAAAWYRRAAEQGYAIAQANLGTMSFDGQGVAKDRVEAYKWEILAVARAPDEEQRKFPSRARETMAKAMTPQEIAKAEKRAQQWLSARHMMEDVVRELAIRLFSGDAGGDRFFVEVEGGLPSPGLLERLRRDPRYRSIAMAKAEEQNPFGVPAHGTVIRIGPLEWQSDRKALLRLSGSALGEQLLAERDGAGQWSVHVVPGSQQKRPLF